MTNAVESVKVTKSQIAPFKKMEVGQLMRAARDVQQAATGKPADEGFWEGYDRDGLLDVIRHHLPALIAKGGSCEVTSTEVVLPDSLADGEDYTAEQLGYTMTVPAKAVKAKKPKAEKAPKSPKVEKPKFKVGQYVQTTDGVLGIVDALEDGNMVRVKWVGGEIDGEIDTLPEVSLLKASRPKVVKPPKAPKVRAPKSTFRVGTRVNVTIPAEEEGGQPTVTTGYVAAVSFNEGREEVGVSFGQTTEVEDGQVAEVVTVYPIEQVSKAPREKAVKEKLPRGERKRRISPEIITAIRTKRVAEGASYAKLANWLREEHGLQVTGDLVRSICVGEIYRDIEMPVVVNPLDDSAGEEVAAEATEEQSAE